MATCHQDINSAFYVVWATSKDGLEEICMCPKGRFEGFLLGRNHRAGIGESCTSSLFLRNHNYKFWIQGWSLHREVWPNWRRAGKLLECAISAWIWCHCERVRPWFLNFVILSFNGVFLVSVLVMDIDLWSCCSFGLALTQNLSVWVLMSCICSWAGICDVWYDPHHTLRMPASWILMSRECGYFAIIMPLWEC